MDDGQLESLFTPFTQADSSTSRLYGGTGPSSPFDFLSSCSFLFSRSSPGRRLFVLLIVAFRLLFWVKGLDAVCLCVFRCIRSVDHSTAPTELVESSRANQIDLAVASGLGMHISRELIQVMGGTITVKSSLGVGTTFSVSLPLVRSQKPLRQKAKRRRKKRNASELSGMSVAIVEDNRLERENERRSNCE
jgi:hypothetical protein